MATANIKFSNNPQSLSWTASNISANGAETKVTALQGYSASSVSGKQINQIEIVSHQGGDVILQVKTDGAGKNDKQAKTNGNNVINYDQPINIDSLRIVLTKA